MWNPFDSLFHNHSDTACQSTLPHLLTSHWLFLHLLPLLFSWLLVMPGQASADPKASVRCFSVSFSSLFYVVRAFDDNKWEFVYAVVRLLDFMFCGKLWFYVLWKTYTCVCVWWTLNFHPLPKCQHENDKNLKVQIDLVCEL